MFDIQQTHHYAKWFAGLRDRAARGRIVARIERLQWGHFGDARAVGEGVSELRMDFGPGYRIYFTQRGERLVLLLCGGDKDSQSRDIAQAKRVASELEPE